MTERVLLIDDEAGMIDAGRGFANALEEGTSLFLSGELGAGKTTFARGIARGLGHVGAVKSPTYTLVEPYLDLEKPLYHFDLYRLGSPEELEFMGIRDYFDAGAMLVLEWPERAGDFLPVPDLEISIVVSGNRRALTAKARSQAGDICLSRLRL
ncbi:MAG: tRNA (adenosine(37)-N6)-threonylcarbamoyltransferase complex ATPase subunit type 1 TsaE [Congregibacter sp.]